MVGSSPDVFGYDLLSQLAPLILEHQGNGTMSAVLMGPNDPPQKIQVGNYTLDVGPRASRGPAARRSSTAAGSPAPLGGDVHCRRGLTSISRLAAA